MKLNQLAIIATLSLGTLLTLTTDVKAQDTTTTNTPAAGAQMATPPRRGARGPNIDMLAKQLSLTDEQKTNVLAAITDQRKKMMDVRGDTSLSTEDRRAKNKEIRDAYLAKMKEILTPEQYTKFQTMMPGRRQAPPAAAGGAPVAAPGTGN